MLQNSVSGLVMLDAFTYGKHCRWVTFLHNFAEKMINKKTSIFAPGWWWASRLNGRLHNETIFFAKSHWADFYNSTGSRGTRLGDPQNGHEKFNSVTKEADSLQATVKPPGHEVRLPLSSPVAHVRAGQKVDLIVNSLKVRQNRSSDRSKLDGWASLAARQFCLTNVPVEVACSNQDKTSSVADLSAAFQLLLLLVRLEPTIRAKYTVSREFSRFSMVDNLLRWVNEDDCDTT